MAELAPSFAIEQLTSTAGALTEGACIPMKKSAKWRVPRKLRSFKGCDGLSNPMNRDLTAKHLLKLTGIAFDRFHLDHHSRVRFYTHFDGIDQRQFGLVF